MKLTSFHTLFLILAVFSLSALIPNSALHQEVSLGAFLNPQPTCPPATCTGIGTDHITWGVPDPSVSSLGFRGRSFTTEVGQTFVVGELDYSNGTTKGGTAIDTVDLCIQVIITQPESKTLNRCQKIIIINSLNTSDPYASADRVSVQRGPDFFVFEEASASASLLGKIRQPIAIADQSSEELELEIIGFGEITGGGGFLRSFVYLPLIRRG